MKKTCLIVVAALSIFCCSCDLDKLDTTAFRANSRASITISTITIEGKYRLTVLDRRDIRLYTP